MSQNPLDLFPHHPLEFDMVMDLKSYTLINVIPPGKKSFMLKGVILFDLFADLILDVPNWNTALEDSCYPEISQAHSILNLISELIPKLSSDFLLIMVSKHRHDLTKESAST